MKKMISIAAALALMTAFTSCSRKPEIITQEENVQVTQVMYKEENIEIAEDRIGMPSLVNIQGQPGIIYFSKDGLKLRVFDSQMAIAEEKVIWETEEPEFYAFRTDSNGDIYGVIIDVKADPKLIGTEEYFETAEISVFIKRWDSSGKLLSDIEIIGINKYFTFGMDNLQDIISYGNKYIIQFSSGIVLVDSNGVIEDYNDGKSSRYAFGKDSNGEVIISDSKGFSIMDGVSLKISENTVTFDKYIMRNGCIFDGTNGFRAYFKMNDGIFGLTQKDELVEVLNFQKSRITGSDIIYVIPVSVGKFLIYGCENETGIQYFSTFTARPDDYVENHEKVDIAMIDYKSPELEHLVNQYNKKNDNYTVEIHTASSEDEIKGKILSGEAPDIYIYNDIGTMYRFTNMGAFSDMKKLQEEYGGFTTDDLCENIAEAFDYRGGLYAITDHFMVDASFGRDDVIGSKYRDWNFNEFIDKASDLPEDMYLTNCKGMNTPEDIFDYLCLSNLNAWIDYDKCESRFGSDEFIRVLEFCKEGKVQPKFDWQEFYKTATEDEKQIKNEEIWAEVRNEKAMFEIGKIFNGFSAFDDISSQYNLNFDDVTLLHAPSFDGKGSIQAVLLYSITSNGKCIEGGWDFMNYIMSDECQVKRSMTSSSGHFSTLKSAFEANAKHDQWISCNSEIPMDDGTISHNFEFMSGPMTDEAMRKIIDFISECTKVKGDDEAVRSIVSEEFGRYIEGEKTAEECAELIQNRIDIFLSKQK